MIEPKINPDEDGRTREGKDPATGKMHQYKTKYYRSPEHIVVQKLITTQGEDSAH